MRILLIEDETALAEAIQYLLKKSGYLVDLAHEGNKGWELAATDSYDLIIVDWMLPNMDGVEIIRAIRETKINTPIMLLTAKDSVENRVEGLDSGADDYLLKPFAHDELLARIRSLLRRRDKEIVDNVLSIGDIILFPDSCECKVNDTIIRLTPKEAALLELLMRNANQTLSKTRIFEKIWGYVSEAELNNVDLYVHYLRKKLNNNYIKNVRGSGYYFVGNADV